MERAAKMITASSNQAVSVVATRSQASGWSGSWSGSRPTTPHCRKRNGPLRPVSIDFSAGAPGAIRTPDRQARRGKTDQGCGEALVLAVVDLRNLWRLHAGSRCADARACRPFLSGLLMFPWVAVGQGGRPRAGVEHNGGDGPVARGRIKRRLPSEQARCRTPSPEPCQSTSLPKSDSSSRSGSRLVNEITSRVSCVRTAGAAPPMWTA